MISRNQIKHCIFQDVSAIFSVFEMFCMFLNQSWSYFMRIYFSKRVFRILSIELSKLILYKISK